MSYDLKIYEMQSEEVSGYETSLTSTTLYPKIVDFINNNFEDFSAEIGSNNLNIICLNKKTNVGFCFGKNATGTSSQYTKYSIGGIYNSTNTDVNQNNTKTGENAATTVSTNSKDWTFFYLKNDNDLIFSPIATTNGAFNTLCTNTPFYFQLSYEDIKTKEEGICELIIGETYYYQSKSITGTLFVNASDSYYTIPCYFLSNGQPTTSNPISLYNLMNYDITFNGIYLSKIPIPGTSFVCKNLYTVCGNTSPNNIGDMFSVNGEYFILIRNNYGKLALKVS